MSVRKFSTASILSPSYKNSKIWDGETLPGYFESIATYAISSTTQDVTFSNIPQNYQHLQLRIFARTSDAATGQNDVFIQFNGDNGNNYSSHRFIGNGTSVASTSFTSIGSIRLDECIPRSGNSIVVFGSVVIDILDYSNINKNTTVRSIGGVDINGSGSMTFDSGLWMNTNAITSMLVSQSGAGYLTNSNIALYGIRGA